MPQLRQRGKSRTIVDEDAAGRDREWLLDQVSKRSGYEVMSKKHDTKMSYAVVAQQWAFAVSFLNEFTKRRFPHSVRTISLISVMWHTDVRTEWANLFVPRLGRPFAQGNLVSGCKGRS